MTMYKLALLFNVPEIYSHLAQTIRLNKILFTNIQYSNFLVGKYSNIHTLFINSHIMPMFKMTNVRIVRLS